MQVVTSTERVITKAQGFEYMSVFLGVKDTSHK